MKAGPQRDSNIEQGIVKTVRVQFRTKAGIPIKSKYADPDTGKIEYLFLGNLQQKR